VFLLNECLLLLLFLYRYSPETFGVFSLQSRLDRLWGPSRLLSEGYWLFCPRGYSVRGVKLTTHLHVKNVWSYTSTPQYAFMEWCSFKAQRLYLYLFTPSFMLNRRTASLCNYTLIELGQMLAFGTSCSTIVLDGLRWVWEFSNA